MTVKQLIENLQKCPEHYEVWIEKYGEWYRVTNLEVCDYNKEIYIKSF